MIGAIMKPEQTKAEILAEVTDITTKNRALFVTLLNQSLKTEDTAGTCLYAAFMNMTVVGKFTQADVVIRGGDGEGDGGLFVDGVGHGHYWVEADIKGEKYVLDVTADQFGLPAIVVEPLANMAAYYFPGDQDLVNDHVVELMAEIAKGDG